MWLAYLLVDWTVLIIPSITVTDRYPGVGHGWYYNDPTSAASARAREGVEEALEWLLGRRQS